MNIFQRREALANQERIDLPGTVIEVNHQLRLVLYYIDNPHVDEKDFDDLKAHFKKLGYFMQLSQPAASVPAPSRP